MRRLPQPNLTQSKLTSMLQPSSQAAPNSSLSDGQADPNPGGVESAPTVPGLAMIRGPGQPITADFFCKLIGDNTATITTKLDNITGDVASLTRTIESSKAELAAVSAKVCENATDIAQQKAQLEGLKEIMSRLESGGTKTLDGPKELDRDYLRARRSIRMWPIENTSQQTLWKGVGEFLHTAVGIPEADVGPDDIESVEAMPTPSTLRETSTRRPLSPPTHQT